MPRLVAAAADSGESPRVPNRFDETSEAVALLGALAQCYNAKPELGPDLCRGRGTNTRHQHQLCLASAAEEGITVC